MKRKFVPLLFCALLCANTFSVYAAEPADKAVQEAQQAAAPSEKRRRYWGMNVGISFASPFSISDPKSIGGSPKVVNDIKPNGSAPSPAGIAFSALFGIPVLKNSAIELVMGGSIMGPRQDMSAGSTSARYSNGQTYSASDRIEAESGYMTFEAGFAHEFFPSAKLLLMGIGGIGYLINFDQSMLSYKRPDPNSWPASSSGNSSPEPKYNSTELISAAPGLFLKAAPRLGFRTRTGTIFLEAPVYILPFYFAVEDNVDITASGETSMRTVSFNTPLWLKITVVLGFTLNF